MKSRDEHKPKLAPQAMVYPITDLSTFETPSYMEFGEDHQLIHTEAGVPVTCTRYAGMIHPFFAMSGHPTGDRCV